MAIAKAAGPHWYSSWGKNGTAANSWLPGKFSGSGGISICRKLAHPVSKLSRKPSTSAAPPK
jgi:hypothetical protein